MFLSVSSVTSCLEHSILHLSHLSLSQVSLSSLSLLRQMEPKILWLVLKIIVKKDVVVCTAQKIEYIEYFSASFCTEGFINSDHISSFYDILKKPRLMVVKIGTAGPEANV